MHINELTAFARRVNLDRAFAGKLVRIRRDDGCYLTRSGSWSKDPDHAVGYDYNADKVGEQIEQVENQFGAKWEPEVI